MGPTADAIFAFLFKYPLRVFERGELGFAPIASPLVLSLVGLVALIAVLFAYYQVKNASLSQRLVPAVLRSLAVLAVVACLFRPILVVSSAVPQRNVLATLFDDSRSMRIADGNNKETRIQSVQRVFADSAAIVSELSEKFALRVFRFAGDARPATNASSLNATGTRSDLAAALNDVQEELSGLPLAGVILVSDGADNGAGEHSNALLSLRARRVPVHTVGAGRERFERDVALDRVSAPSRVLSGGSFYIEADVRAQGVTGEPLQIFVEANGRILTSDEVTIQRGSETARARLRVPPLDQGNHRLTVRVRPLDNEQVVENNIWQGVLQVRPGPDRILYVEGEPRPEFAFLRRAADGDSGIQVVGLMRSADRKYLRLGVRDSLELVTGFPNSREELFGFRGIILGSIEASFFSGDQLRMLSDFVAQRGGTLLALGGRSALGEGGYAGTVLSDVLPVALTKQTPEEDAAATHVSVRQTAAGVTHSSLQLRENSAASRAKWDSLPPLTTVNKVGPLRAGATLLLAGRPVEGGADVPVLATQRYGRGASAVLAVQDTWLWRMHADMAVDDDSFQTFWRQLLRWMVEGVPDRIDVSISPAYVAPNERVVIKANVSNEAFANQNDATVVAMITSPDGRIRTVPMELSVAGDGNYSAEFETDIAGTYEAIVTASTSTDTAASEISSFNADDGAADISRAELASGLLRRIATETGGRYYELERAQQLVDDVVYTESGVTVREANDLWDMPAVFIFLATVLGAEWAYRRWRGLA